MPDNEMVWVPKGALTDIGDAIREKLGVASTYKLDEMPDAIDGIGGGTVAPLTVTENGTYTPPSGVDGYAPVTVNVSGGGGNTVLCEVDFTKADFTLNNVTYNTSGATFTGANGYIMLPFARSGMTLELDVASMSLGPNTDHRRFIMVNSDQGFIYRYTGVWALYNGSWEDSALTDSALFANSTLKVIVDTANKWHIYKNDVLIWEPSASLAMRPASSTIGASGYSIINTVITGMRVY